jgi:tetratricopeptide (TPR) repeat protein
MVRRGRVALFLLVLSHPLAASPDQSGPQSTPADSQLPAQIERMAVRDTLERDGRIERTTDVRVLVRDPSGVAQFGQIGGPFIEGLGEVGFDRLAIEKPDGRRLAVENGKVEDLNPFGMSAAPVAADFRFRRLTIPGLEPGDRLTYRITLRQKPLIPSVSAGEFKFIVGPIASEQVYELDTPSDLRLNVWRSPDVGADWEELAVSGGRSLRRLSLRAPIAIPKGNLPSDVLVAPDVIYSTFRSWEEVGKWWWGASRDRFQPDATVQAEAERLVKGATEAGARLDALYAFVSGQIRYLSVSFGVGRFEPRPAAEVLSSRYGDCKGKHALLAALGAAAGIEVLPALVNTARKDLNDVAPGLTQFDHVLSVVRKGPDPSEWLWLDTTNDLAPAGQIAPNLRGKRVLLMSPEGVRVVTTPDRLPFPARWTVDSKGSIDAAGPIRARVRITLRDDAEPVVRAAFRMAPRDKWDEAGKSLAKEWSKGEVSDVKAGDPANLREPFWVEYSVVHKMSSKTLEKAWTFWVPLPEISVPAPHKDAKPGEAIADLNHVEDVAAHATFEMPEGMRARAPLSVNLDRPFATYRSTYTLDGRSLTVERVLQIKQRKVTSEQRAAYEAFREAMAADHRQEFPIEAFAAAGAEKLETGDDFNTAGNQALDDGDAKKAEDLYRKATDKEPSHKWAWNNLGRALRKQKRYDEARKAFDRQIEINPYDEYAYENRGSLLAFDLRLLEEGEKDLLKQIEVAPLKPNAYRDLASIRTWQKRFGDAADLMERAAAAKPSDFETLLALTWARARAKKGDVADAAKRAVAADGRPRGAISAARALAQSGDLAGASQIAREAMGKLITDLQTAPPDDDGFNYERDPLYFGEGWRLMGSAALAAGDLATAERYLTASFDVAFTADSAADLVRLRERQGRTREAAALRTQAAPFVRAAEDGARRPGPGASTAPRGTPVTVDANETALRNTIGLRHLKELAGRAPSEDFYIRIRMVVDAGGRVTEVRASEAKHAARVATMRGRVVGLSVVSGNPDKAAFKLTRGGTLSCYKGSMCYLGIDLLVDEAWILEQ